MRTSRFVWEETIDITHIGNGEVEKKKQISEGGICRQRGGKDT